MPASVSDASSNSSNKLPPDTDERLKREFLYSHEQMDLFLRIRAVPKVQEMYPLNKKRTKLKKDNFKSWLLKYQDLFIGLPSREFTDDVTIKAMKLEGLKKECDRRNRVITYSRSYDPNFSYDVFKKHWEFIGMLDYADWSNLSLRDKREEMLAENENKPLEACHIFMNLL